MKNENLINIAKHYKTPVYVYNGNKIKNQFQRLKTHLVKLIISE